MAEQDFDLTEEATPYKLEQARKQGTVSRSADFTSVAVLAAMTGFLYASGWDVFGHSIRLQRSILSHAGTVSFSVESIGSWMGRLAFDALHILAPLFFPVIAVAILVILLQTGPVFSFKPLISIG